MLHAPRALRTCTPLVLSLALLVAGQAHAQTADPSAVAMAQSLYDEAVKAAAKHDYATACPKLEEVVRLVPEGLGAKLTLAECYEGAGRLASAWSMYVIVAQVAVQAKQTERQQLAETRAAALKPKLAELALTVPATGAPVGLEIRRDGVVVGPSQWGLLVPVDKGEHEIAATAPGKRPWKKTVQVKADGDAVTIDVGPLEDAPPPPPRTNTDTKPPVPIRLAAEPFWGAQRVASAAVGGVGVVGLGLGVVFGARALAKKSESNAGGKCHDGNVCNDEGFALREDARSAGNISTALLLVGGAAVAGGAVLFLTARPARGTEVIAGPRGIALRGVW